MTLKQFGITPALKLAFALNVIFPFTFLFAQNENFYDIKRFRRLKYILIMKIGIIVWIQPKPVKKNIF